MSDLNWAYDQVRDRNRRQLYDRTRAAAESAFSNGMQPLGPGVADSFRVVTPPPPSTEPSDLAGPFSRARPTNLDGERYIDFGRYRGWSLRDLLHHDPDYLRWLSRHSSGVRYRADILQLLPAEREEPSPVHSSAR